MARRILNRKELREDYDASERKKDDEETDETEEEEEEEGEEEAADEEEEGEEAAPAEAGEDEEEAPKKKPPKKKKEPVVKPKPKSRARAAKITRMRLVWGVFSNSHQCVATYEYPRRKEADEHAARLTSDKRSTHFVQPVKEPMAEEKKEKEK